MQPEDWGNGVWLFGSQSDEIYLANEFCKHLADFKKAHPDLVVTAIAPYVSGDSGWGFPVTYVVAYIVNTEEKR